MKRKNIRYAVSEMIERAIIINHLSKCASYAGAFHADLNHITHTQVAQQITHQHNF